MTDVQWSLIRSISPARRGKRFQKIAFRRFLKTEGVERFPTPIYNTSARSLSVGIYFRFRLGVSTPNPTPAAIHADARLWRAKRAARFIAAPPPAAIVRTQVFVGYMKVDISVDE